MSNNKRENHLAIVLGSLDFVYLAASLILINPQIYFDSTHAAFSGGYAASGVVYAFGIIFPIWARLIKGDVPNNKLLRIADISALVFAILDLLGILVYFILDVGGWVAWLSYIMALLTSAPSIFSIILSAREYVSDVGIQS